MHSSVFVLSQDVYITYSPPVFTEFMATNGKTLTLSVFDQRDNGVWNKSRKILDCKGSRDEYGTIFILFLAIILNLFCHFRHLANFYTATLSILQDLNHGQDRSKKRDPGTAKEIDVFASVGNAGELT